MSVLVVVYESSVKKLLITIASILVQKGISKQIVICDDGSDSFPLDETIRFFELQNFTDYIFCLSKENRGIVQNVLNGIEECRGEYLKLISPGDYLHKENTLLEWYKLVKHKDADLSISNAIYYKKHLDGRLEAIRHRNNPQINKHYYQNQWYYNYLIFDDIALGACILSKTDVTRKYLLLIKDRVKFAEDNVYRIMAADKLLMVYFENDSLLYEYGTGISTGGKDIWSKRIIDDWNETNKIILERINKSGNLEKSFRKVIKSRNKKGIEAKLYKLLNIRGFFQNYLRSKLKPKYTNLQIDMPYFEKIKNY
ncbi:MAG: glycosyltransferase family 2 protein [Treponema sp.]|nr:glycosyltransferase family 2 protein [Treponema sp.]